MSGSMITAPRITIAKERRAELLKEAWALIGMGDPNGIGKRFLKAHSAV